MTRLSSPAREVLDVAALIGARVDLRLLAAVSDYPPAALDELLASGLLGPDSASLKFRHEIVRLAVEGAITTHRCGPIHARILAALRGTRLRRRRPAGLPRRGGGGRLKRRWATRPPPRGGRSS